MSNERFPKTRYMGELTRMAATFRNWAEQYRAAAMSAEPEWLQGRFMDRAALMTELELDALELSNKLGLMPRLQ
jgi:hypothetical protein